VNAKDGRGVLIRLDTADLTQAKLEQLLRALLNVLDVSADNVDILVDFGHVSDPLLAALQINPL
jgi:hypothetical protein